MPDGYKRKRRNRGDMRSKWYAAYRSARFAWLGVEPADRVIDITLVCYIIVEKGEKK